MEPYLPIGEYGPYPGRLRDRNSIWDGRLRVDGGVHVDVDQVSVVHWALQAEEWVCRSGEQCARRPRAAGAGPAVPASCPPPERSCGAGADRQASAVSAAGARGRCAGRRQRAGRAGMRISGRISGPVATVRLVSGAALLKFEQSSAHLLDHIESADDRRNLATYIAWHHRPRLGGQLADGSIKPPAWGTARSQIRTTVQISGLAPPRTRCHPRRLQPTRHRPVVRRRTQHTQPRPTVHHLRRPTAYLWVASRPLRQARPTRCTATARADRPGPRPIHRQRVVGR
jgi:hypothetical protein